MATVPASAYIGKLQFKNGSTSATLNQYVAKFLFGARTDGGYYDTSDTTITDATTIAAIRTALKTEFKIDEIYVLTQSGKAKGFVGMVVDGGTHEGYHNMTVREGHKMTKNGVTYIALNDAGLHCIGEGNVNFSYLFENKASGYATLKAPIYDKCTYTMQYSVDQSTWYTYASINNKQVAAKTQSEPLSIGDLPNLTGQGGSSAKLYWRLVATNDEGTRNIGTSLNLKPSAYMCQSEYFLSFNSSTYSGNGTGRSLYMYQSAYDAIIAACRSYTRPVAEGHDYWERGDKISVSTAGLDTIYVYGSWAKLYKDTAGAAYTGHAGYYLLTKNYGVQINTYGKVTYIFYAYEAPGTNIVIRLTASFWRGDYDEESETWPLTATVVGEYVGGTATFPSTTANITVSCQFSTYDGGPSAAGAHIYGESATNYKEDSLTVAPGSGAGTGAFFAGYTESDTIQGVRITVKSNDSDYTASVTYA